MKTEKNINGKPAIEHKNLFSITGNYHQLEQIG